MVFSSRVFIDGSFLRSCHLVVRSGVYTTFLFSGGNGEGYFLKVIFDDNPMTRAYWSRGWSVPDMWTVPFVEFRNLDISSGSMQQALRYSPSLSAFTVRTKRSEAVPHHDWRKDATDWMSDIRFSPFSMRASVLCSPRSSIVSMAASRSACFMPNLALMRSSISGPSITAVSEPMGMRSVATPRMQALRNVRNEFNGTSPQTMG